VKVSLFLDCFVVSLLAMTKATATKQLSSNCSTTKALDTFSRN